jgi:hypothetical protein
MLSSLLFMCACGGALGRSSTKAGPMPPGGSFTGVWFSPQYGEMHLVQNGATVFGRFERDERSGRIQGSVTGDVMRFEWTESRELIVGRPTITKGRGYFRIMRDEAEDTWKVMGEWGHDDDESGGGPWNAVKSKTRQPEVGSAGSSGDEEAVEGDSAADGDGASDPEAGELNDL